MKGTDKKILLFLPVAFFGFCAFFAAQKIMSFDVWWHLKTGEWIWHNMAVPTVDQFSYTFQGTKWIDFEWLFQAVIYPIYQFGGFGGLIIFKIVIILLTFLVLFLTCREADGGKRWLSVTLLFIALLVARGRFMVRPDIIFLLFLALYSYLLILYRGEKITTSQLIVLLLPTHVLWVNFHGSFLLGIFLVGAFALGRFVPLAMSHYRDLKPVFQDVRLQNLLFLCLLLCLVSFLNPHTYQVFFVPFKTAGSGEALSRIAEWTPVDIRGLGLFIIDFTVWFRALFLLGVFSFLISRKNFTKVEDIIIFTLFSYMAFKYIRFSGAFAIAALPIIANNFSQFRWQVRGWKWIRVLPILIIIVFSVNDVIALQKKERIGFGVWENYPKATVDFLKKHDVNGRILNTYGYGGYIIWHLYPAIPVFIDGRTPTIYDQDFLWLYNLMERKKELWEKVAGLYGIEIVLVRDDRERGYATLFYWLDEDEDWRLMAFDDVSNLYMKKGAKFNGLIEKYGFRYLRPSDLSMDYAKEKKDDKRYLEALERELKEACQRFPRYFYPFYYLGIYHQIYGTKNHFQEAEKALRKAVSNRPDFPRGHYELGFTLMKLERYKEAAEAFKKAIKIKPNLPADAYYYLGVSLYEKGDVDDAVDSLEKYKKRAGLGTRIEAYRLLGEAYIQEYKFRKALSCFKRVRYLGEPTWEFFANMGIAYFGLDMLEQARSCFEEAMEMNPEEMKVMYNLAVTYEKLQLFKRAKDLFRQVADMGPKSLEEEVWVEKAKNKIQKKMID
jgi:tetratricopeptide (TPR) repeat protein